MMRMIRHRFRSDSGYSLAELLVVAALIPLVLGVAFMILQLVTGVVDRTEATDIANSNGRRAMERLGRELRQAQETVEGEGAFEDAQPRRCVFFADLDHDGVPEKVAYRVVGKNLYRTQAHATTAVPPYTWGPDEPETLVIDSLNGGWNGNVFDYYDTQDPPQQVSPGHSEEISAVRVHLVSGGSSGKVQVFVDLSTWIRIRAVNNGID